MPSPGLLLPDAIRIEDEVWQEAFTRRERGRSRAVPRSRATAQAPETLGPRETPRPPTTPRPREAPRPRATPPPPAPVRPAARTTRPYAAPANGRRTVTITGRGAERHLPRPGEPGHRPIRRAHERTGFRPDRVSMWAVLLGMLLLAVAIASPHG